MSNLNFCCKLARLTIFTSKIVIETRRYEICSLLGLLVETRKAHLSFKDYFGILMQEHLKRAIVEEKYNWTSANANFEITLKLMRHLK